MNPPWEIRFAKKVDTMWFWQPRTLNIPLYYDSGTCSRDPLPTHVQAYRMNDKIALRHRTKRGPRSADQSLRSSSRLWNKVLDGIFSARLFAVLTLNDLSLIKSDRWLSLFLRGFLNATCSVTHSKCHVAWDSGPVLTGAGTSCSSQMALLIS